MQVVYSLFPATYLYFPYAFLTGKRKYLRAQISKIYVKYFRQGIRLNHLSIDITEDIIIYDWTLGKLLLAGCPESAGQQQTTKKGC
jgi:hypothetical protein